MDGCSNDSLSDHPVLFKITTLKKTLDGLQGIDEKLEKALRMRIKGKSIERRRVEEEEEEEEEEEGGESGEEEEEGEEEDVEMEEEEELLTKAEKWNL